MFQITKKLAGTAKGTALWMSSVGNEKGEILMSVLTAQEGEGLDLMVAGLERRYFYLPGQCTICIYCLQNICWEHEM